MADDASTRVAAFFAAKKIPNDCPICGNTTWSVFNIEGGQEYVLPLGVQGEPFPVVGPGVYAMCCNNCGFVRQHLRNIVDGDLVLKIDQVRADVG